MVRLDSTNIADIRPGDTFHLKYLTGSHLADATLTAQGTIPQLGGIAPSALSEAGWTVVSIDREPSFTPGLYLGPEGDPTGTVDLYVATATTMVHVATGKDASEVAAVDPRWGKSRRMLPLDAAAEEIIRAVRDELRTDDPTTHAALDRVLTKFTDR